jgi:diguanylate cyclase (GGDEF)-like protein
MNCRDGFAKLADNQSMEASDVLGHADVSDRVQLLEATLDLLDEGVAILDGESKILFWNKAAAALTGRSPEELVSSRCPDDLYRIDEQHRSRVAQGAGGCRCGAEIYSSIARSGWTVTEDPDRWPTLDARPEIDHSLGSPTLISMNHKLGHRVSGMLRKVALRNMSGESTGTALLFYPVEETDALPHGETGDGAGIERSQAEMEDRLDAAHHQWATSRMPFGLLWITVDQARSLRRTHGRDACEAMLRTVEQTLLRQMKPAEIIGRWGNNEFLVLAHERTPELLLEHARRLVGLARTADFRWWGDRVGLTVSIGASHALEGDTLQSLLNRASQAMQASQYAGGNHVTEARKA